MFTGTLKPAPFRVDYPSSDIDDLKTLVRLARLPPPTYEGKRPDFGMSNTWMRNAKEYWQNDFDWSVRCISESL